jgi:4-hydroxy-tetrahydrodipicolinate synthase
MQLLKNKPEDFLVLGDDMIVLPMVLAGGWCYLIGQGFPKEFSEMIRLGLNRKVDEAFKSCMCWRDGAYQNAVSHKSNTALAQKCKVK